MDGYTKPSSAQPANTPSIRASLGPTLVQSGKIRYLQRPLTGTGHSKSVFYQSAFAAADRRSAGVAADADGLSAVVGAADRKVPREEQPLASEVHRSGAPCPHVGTLVVLVRVGASNRDWSLAAPW
jgi:hypothetical protein